MYGNLQIFPNPTVSPIQLKMNSNQLPQFPLPFSAMMIADSENSYVILGEGLKK